VFKLTPSSDGSWKFSLLHTFAGGKDGVQPQGPLALDPAGNLYGTTFTGGNYDAGIAYQLAPTKNGAWKESAVHTFTGCQDGAGAAGLALDTKGNLFGTTALGGLQCSPSGNGVVFELSRVSGSDWKENALHLFTDGADGGDPDGILLSSGTVYGTAAIGGKRTYCREGCGLVFRLAPDSNGVWVETVLHDFNGGNGLFPGALLFDNAGNLYGTTDSGGSGTGLVFELTPDVNWSETVLYQFSGGTDGGGPAGPIVFDRAGNLYGTADGGTAAKGVVFEVTP
jgi:hypothetical protein